jgi:signal transduction histidine kinase
VVVFRDVTKEREVDKAKTEFVSLASHQLRTPLSAVNWYAEMLLAGDVGKLNDEQKKYIDEIYKGNQRMVDLVNALLDVSRIELGTFAISPEPTQLTDISKSIIKELKPEIKKKNQVVSEDYEKNLPKINVDQKLIRIVIQNLLSNAVKYTPEKGRIGIEMKTSGANIEIKVADTGYGIPKPQQKDIFTKLFRADNVRQKDTEGTGLGLYIVKNIVEQSGGKISFDSTEDKGTTFYVTIPLGGMNKKEGTRVLEDIK